MQHTEKRASFSLDERSLFSLYERTLSNRSIEKRDSTLSLYSFYQGERLLLSREERDSFYLEKTSLIIVSIDEERFLLCIEEESP